MRKYLLSIIAIAAVGATTAFADEIASINSATGGLSAPLWRGFYAGLNTGAVFGGNNTVTTTSSPVNDTSGISPNLMFGSAAVASTSMGVNNLGFIGGGQVGYNWQFSENILFGAEADIQGTAGAFGSSSKATGTALPGTPIGNLTSFATISKGLDYFGTLRGRVGYLLKPELLIYGAGGLAYGGIQANTKIFQTGLDDVAPPPVVPLDPISGNSSGMVSHTEVGWTAGGGLEWMFSQNWSARAEYLYYDLGNTTYALSPLAIFNYTRGSFTASVLSNSTSHFNGNIIRVGVNYHFSSASVPIVANF